MGLMDMPKVIPAEGRTVRFHAESARERPARVTDQAQIERVRKWQKAHPAEVARSRKKTDLRKKIARAEGRLIRIQFYADKAKGPVKAKLALLVAELEAV